LTEDFSRENCHLQRNLFHLIWERLLYHSLRISPNPVPKIHLWDISEVKLFVWLKNNNVYQGAFKSIFECQQYFIWNGKLWFTILRLIAKKDCSTNLKCHFMFCSVKKWNQAQYWITFTLRKTKHKTSDYGNLVYKFGFSTSIDIVFVRCHVCYCLGQILPFVNRIFDLNKLKYVISFRTSIWLKLVQGASTAYIDMTSRREFAHSSR